MIRLVLSLVAENMQLESEEVSLYEVWVRCGKTGTYWKALCQQSRTNCVMAATIARMNGKKRKCYRSTGQHSLELWERVIKCLRTSF